MEMIGEKCPLCDGPVSGGRCTLCGMPYRKDEILYHLNENSRDHYKHATEKARSIMRKNAGVSGTRAVGKNASEADIRAHQQQVRQEAVKRMTTTKTPAADSGRKSAKKKNLKKAEAAYGSAKKKSGKGKIILWIIVILLILLPSILDFVEEKVDQYAYEQMEDTYGIGSDTETYSMTGGVEGPYLIDWTEGDGRNGYEFLGGFGPAQVGEDIRPGKYDILGTSEEESLTLVLENETNITEIYITPDDYMTGIDFREGDTIRLEDCKDEEGVYLYGVLEDVEEEI